MYSLPGNAFKFTLGFDPLPLSRVRGELSREPIHVLVVVVAVCREFPTASSNKVGRRKELGEGEEEALILSVSCPTRIVKIQNKSGHYAFLSLSFSQWVHLPFFRYRFSHLPPLSLWPLVLPIILSPIYIVISQPLLGSDLPLPLWNIQTTPFPFLSLSFVEKEEKKCRRNDSKISVKFLSNWRKS